VISFAGMKIKGWKRIGIIASVVWILGAGLYTFITIRHSEIKTARELTLGCESTHYGHSSNECDNRGTDYLVTAKWDPWVDSAAVAVVPVLFVWGFVCLVLFLVGWVKG
jgi:hypothetical protein